MCGASKLLQQPVDLRVAIPFVRARVLRAFILWLRPLHDHVLYCRTRELHIVPVRTLHGHTCWYFFRLCAQAALAARLASVRATMTGSVMPEGAARTHPG
jgi:hypothetical protein